MLEMVHTLKLVSADDKLNGLFFKLAICYIIGCHYRDLTVFLCLSISPTPISCRDGGYFFNAHTGNNA